MANPYQFFVGTFVGGGGVAQSGNWTFTFHNTSGFDVYVPIQITNANTGNISAGAEVTVLRSADGGVTWETEAPVRSVFNRPTAAQVQRKAIRLGTGSFILRVMVGGGQTTTWTAQALTAWLNTAIN